MNRIAVVSMMKNEADIVESWARHAFQFADKIFVCDHKSTDRTREILESLQSEGLPIEISTFDRDELAMSKINTNLMSKAFSEGFDLVVPIDADEFPLMPNGNSSDLRQYLQSLDTNQYYQIYLWEHRFTDKDESRYALSRSIVRAKSFEIALPKIFVGREFAKNHVCSIIHGNHNLVFVDEDYIPYTPLNTIHYAHFSQRSSEQLISKMITNHLNNRLMGTRYCIFPQIGFEHPAIDNLNFEIDLTGFEPIDFSAYKDECALKYSRIEEVNSRANLFNLSNNLVDTLSRERILSKRDIVRIFVFFDGDVERATRSLESCFAQTYEFKKIFVVVKSQKNIGDLILAMKDRSGQIEFIDLTELRKTLESPDGSFIQFVIPGDKLHPDKIMHCVEQMSTTYNPTITLCDIKSSQPPIHPTHDLKLIFQGDLHVNMRSGGEVIRVTVANRHVLNLSRFFFRQSVFDEAHGCQAWLNTNPPDILTLEMTTFVLIMQTIQDYTIYFLKEDLVESGARSWNQWDWDNYNTVCGNLKTIQR